MSKTITVKYDGYELQVSYENAKMHHVGIFNLPEKFTCPGATAVCRKMCYAAKASRLYPQVAPRRWANLEASKSDCFISLMGAAIDKLRKVKDFTGYFRIHESGDFYSQRYVDAWAYIASCYPNIKFLAFTKSSHLDFSKMPDNVQIVLSVMSDTNVDTLLATKTRNPFKLLAFAGCHKDETVQFTCPGGRTNCNGCGFKCWHLDEDLRDVYFEIH